MLSAVWSTRVWRSGTIQSITRSLFMALSSYGRPSYFYESSSSWSRASCPVTVSVTWPRIPA